MNFVTEAVNEEVRVDPLLTNNICHARTDKKYEEAVTALQAGNAMQWSRSKSCTQT